MVLTKPLGTQLAVNAFQWMKNDSAQYQKIKEIVTVSQVEKAFRDAVMSMATLNLQASRLMKKH